MPKDGADLLAKALRRARSDLENHRDDLEQEPKNNSVAAGLDDDAAETLPHTKLSEPTLGSPNVVSCDPLGSIMPRGLPRFDSRTPLSPSGGWVAFVCTRQRSARSG